MKFWITVVAGFGIGISAVHPSSADSIVINGQRLDNVLVTKTSAFYYVQLPKEGRTLNIPIDNVNAADVTINNDPFFRDDLKAKYAENKALREAGEAEDADADPSFRAGAGSASSAGGTVGGGAGLGTSRTQAEQALSGMGANFQPGPGRNGLPSVVANVMGAKLELIGPPETLMGIILSATAPAPQIEMMIGQQRMMAQQGPPEQGQLLNRLIDEAKQNGTSSGTAGGVKYELKYKPNGELVEFESKTFPAG